MKNLSLLSKLIGVLLFCSSVQGSAEWIRGGNGFLGPDPVYSGTVEGWDLYVCAGLTRNGYQAGHLANGQTRCYVAWGSSSIGFTNYMVLNGSAGYEWVNRNNTFGRRPVFLSDENSQPTGVCRSSGNYHNGKMLGYPRNGICYNAWGSGNRSFGDFDVLVHR